MANQGSLKVVAAAALAVSGLAISSQSANAAPIVWGVTVDNTLFNFDATTPGNIISGAPISGFTSPGENIRGIDFRPANGQLYALGSFGRLYTLDTNTAILTPVGTGAAINGTAFGFDFNPAIDRIRVVSNSNANYVYHPDTGVQTVATNLFYGAADPNFGVDPNVVGSAYSVTGTNPTTSQLFGIDSGLDILVTQANSAGTLGTVGPLGANIGDLTGFDVFTNAQGANTAYASLTPVGSSASNFYTINLATGLATNQGQISGGMLVNDIAVVPIPEPTVMTLAGIAAAGLLVLRRRA
jgi:hypothetical protein